MVEEESARRMGVIVLLHSVVLSVRMMFLVIVATMESAEMENVCARLDGQDPNVKH